MNRINLFLILLGRGTRRKGFEKGFRGGGRRSTLR